MIEISQLRWLSTQSRVAMPADLVDDYRHSVVRFPTIAAATAGPWIPRCVDPFWLPSP
jgi:hypothetical protein